MNKPNYLIFANDEKMKICMQVLRKHGYLCQAADGENLAEQLSLSTDIILPLPSIKNGFIAGTDMTWDDLAVCVSKNHRVFCGNLKNPNLPCRCDSYYFDDDFLMKNSRLTAQGVLKIVLENIKCDLTDLSVAVLGYGRCGRAICSLLMRCGCQVTAFARREESRAEAEKRGIPTENLNQITATLYRYDVTVNTIPSNIVSDDCLSALTENNIYIEIASKPYGFDSASRQSYKFHYILAESLPGKFTPWSAGRNIAETVIRRSETDE